MKTIETITPLGKTVVVRREEFQPPGLILLTGNKDVRCQRLRVVSVGPDATRCKAGDYILVDGDARMTPVDPLDDTVLVFPDDKVVMATATFADEQRLD